MSSKQVCFDCGSKCCQSVSIAINKDESASDPFLERYPDEMPEGHNLWDDDDQRKNNWFYTSNSEPCMFFDEKKQECGIEEKKPIICKLYPLKWKHQFSFFISLACPLAHHVPLKEIVAWANPYMKIIADIELYNDFDQNDTEKYIGIRRLESRFDLEIYDNGLIKNGS